MRGQWGPYRGRVRPVAGQALVELALILPILLLLTAGTIELGRAFLAASTVEAGAYRGATFAAFTRANALDTTAVRDAVVSDWGPLPQSASNPAVTVTLAREPTPPASTADSAQDAVTVAVEYTLTPLLAWPGVPTIPILRSSVTMRVQP
jgi:Flp pilus assembly protein TadG